MSALFRAHGASEANAAIVSAHLVQSEQLHLPSHGLIRVRQYVKEILAGELLPDAVPTSTESAPTVRAIDGHLGFGQVAGMAATQAAQSVAEQFGTAFVTVRNVQHTGRLGAYTEPLARRGLLGRRSRPARGASIASSRSAGATVGCRRTRSPGRHRPQAT